MGFVFSKIFSGLVGNDQMRIIIIGLDNAGKTTILCKLISDQQTPSRWDKPGWNGTPAILADYFINHSLTILFLNYRPPPPQ